MLLKKKIHKINKFLKYEFFLTNNPVQIQIVNEKYNRINKLKINKIKKSKKMIKIEK